MVQPETIFLKCNPDFANDGKQIGICLFSQKSNKWQFAKTNKSTNFVGDLENRNYEFLIISLKKKS